MENFCATLWSSFSIIHVNVEKIKNYVERKNRLCYTRKTSLATPNWIIFRQDKRMLHVLDSPSPGLAEST